MDKKEFIENIIEDDFDNLEEQQPQDVPKGKVEKIPLIMDKEKRVRKIRANLTRILTYYDENLIDLFIYNEATHNIEIVEDRQIGIHTLKKGIYNDASTVQIASYIANRYLLDYQNSLISDEVEAIALTRSYNPIKSFLQKALINKQKKDPFKIIQKYLNIEDTEYNRIAFDLFFRGAIARVIEPGIQFDFCLDLVGPQGGRKTTFLRQIFMNWYTDQIETFNKKDDLALMVQAWLVNDDELEATAKISFGGLKKVITLSEISFRPPYARSIRSQKIDFVFSRTTNETDFLGDATGDRRFIGIRVEKTTPQHCKKITETDLMDIWGNYYASYLENDRLYYDETASEYKLIEQERNKFKKVDDTIELLTWYLEQPIPDDFYSPCTQDWKRRSYYHDLQSTGIAYRSSDKDNYKIVWQGTVQRDRVSVADIVNELFFDQKNNRTLRKKIRLYFDNLPNWEKKKGIKFGKRSTSGYQLKEE